MFTNVTGTGVEIINRKLENITLNITTMQPKTDRPPVAPRCNLPTLHLTPSGGHSKSPDANRCNNDPKLLRPHHDIPHTPPPQRNQTQPFDFFPQRIG